jgi:hypothetical protein
MHRLLILAVLSCTFLNAEASDIVTAQMLNGRGWQGLSSDQRISYTVAILDQTAYAYIMGKLNEPDEVAEGFTVRDYVKELDELYSSRENILLPVPLALDFCTRKFRGQTTQKDLEAALIKLRETASAWTVAAREK